MLSYRSVPDTMFSILQKHSEVLLRKALLFSEGHFLLSVLLGMLPTVLSVRRCHLPDFLHLLPAGSALKAPGILRVRL